MFLAAGRGDFVLGSLAGIEGTVRKKRAYDEVLEITRVTYLPAGFCPPSYDGIRRFLPVGN